MIYGTIAAFRATFTSSGVDEFVTRSDEDLQEALGAASAELDSYIATPILSEKALDVLTRKCYFLARLFVYKDQALDVTHPVVREAENVRRWLRYFSEGRVSLPGDALGPQIGGITGTTRTFPVVEHMEKYQ